MPTSSATPKSFLAQEYMGEEHDLTVCRSQAGHYLGVVSDKGPLCRDSEYFPNREAAQSALDNGTWTQRQTP